MLSKLGVIVILSIFLSACASQGATRKDYYGSGTGVNTNSNQFSNATVLGAAGAVAGATLTKKSTLGAVIGGIVGYYSGRALDVHERAEVEEKLAIGSTDCGYSAQKSGNDRNGSYQQTANSRKIVAGYKADCN